MDVRAAGARGAVGSERPQCNQFSWLLCQWAPRLAAYEQDKRGSDALDGAGCRERYGTQLPLAGWAAGGYALEGDWPVVFRLAGYEPGPFPQSQLDCKHCRTLSAKHNRILRLKRNTGPQAEWSGHRFHRLSGGVVRRTLGRALSFRFCSPEKSQRRYVEAVSCASDSECSLSAPVSYTHL